MSEIEVLLVITILVAVAFDFTNGFHDTANAIATSVSTRALTPSQAVVVSTVFNLVGALVTLNVFHAKVSNTIAGPLAVKAGLVVVVAALVGAIAWNLLTWYLGLPSSSTHALIGGLVGAGIAAAGGFDGVKWASLGKQIVALVTSPPIGFAVAGIFMTLLLLAVYRARPARLNRAFRWIQVVAAAFVSFSH